MNNFYLGFKGNVFSKMFMMFAVFMAMSGGLFGASFTLTAETVDNNGDGYLDYVKIVPMLADNNSTNIDINFTNVNALKVLFSKSGYDSSFAQVEEIEGIYDNIGDSTKITTQTTTSGKSFYLKFKSDYIKKYNTGVSYSITYDASVHAYMSNGTDKFSNKGSLTATDKAKPVLMDVKIASIDGSADTIDLNFSEPVNFVSATYNEITTNSIKDSNITFIGVGESFEYNVSYASGKGSNVLKFKINNGITKENFLNKTTINVNIKDNAIKDTASNILNALSNPKLSNSTSLETTSPSIKPTSTLNFNTKILTAQVSELLKGATSDNIHLKVSSIPVSSSSRSFTLTTSATYNSAGPSLSVNFANIDHDIVELSKVLSNDINFSLSMVIDSGSTVTDARGNSVSTYLVPIPTANYTEDNTSPTVSTTYFPPKIIQLNFSDAISISDANLSIYLDMNYTDNNATPSISSWTKYGRDINITFSQDLNDSEIVNIRTKPNYTSPSASIKNYVNLGLEAFSTNTTISPAPPKPEYKEFVLDMDMGKIILPFNNVNASYRFNTLSGTNFGSIDVNISNGTNTKELLPSYYNMETTDNDENITITLNAIGHRELSIFLGNVTRTSISLNMGNMSSGTILTNGYGDGPEANASVGVSRYTKDATDPKVENWSFDLDNKKIRINFNIPIYFDNNATINNKFVIASANTLGATGSDTFGYFNTIDVGDIVNTNTTVILDSNKTTLTFSLNDSFVEEILNDRNLSTSSGASGNAFLVIRSNNGILNINQVADNNLSETNSSNRPKALSTLTADKGNVNVLFTANRGVSVFNNYNPSDDNLTANKWYMMTIPWGIDISAEELKATNHFATIWEHTPVIGLIDNNGWTQPTGDLNSSKGYWMQTQTYTDIKWKVSIKADINTSRPNESISDFKTRVKVSDQKYRLIGLNNDVSMGVIKKHTDYSHYGNTYQVCVHYFNAKSGAWDDKLNLKAGNALWVKQGCTKTYQNNDTSRLD